MFNLAREILLKFFKRMSAGDRARRPRGLLVNLFLSAISFLVALALLEGALVLAHYEYRPLNVKISSRSDWRYLHMFQDFKTVYDSKLLWRTPMKYIMTRNAYPAASMKPPANRPPGELRILVLGDSNAQLGWPWGMGAFFAKNFTNSILTNGACAGYTSYQGLEQLKEMIEFAPDLVVVSFGANDNNLVTLSDSQFANRWVKKFSLDKTLTNFRLGRWILSCFDKIAYKRSRKLKPRVSLGEYANNLQQMIEIANTKRSKIVFVSRPFLAARGSRDDLSPYNTVAKTVATTNKVLFVDTTKLFENKKEYFTDSAHLNRQGQLLMSFAVTEAIVEHYFQNARQKKTGAAN